MIRAAVTNLRLAIGGRNAGVSSNIMKGERRGIARVQMQSNGRASKRRGAGILDAVLGA